MEVRNNFRVNPMTKNPINFKAKINWIPNSELDKITEGTKNFLGAPWGVENTISKQQESFTTKIRTCTCVVLTNAKTGLASLFHLVPEDYAAFGYNNHKKINKRMTKEVKELGDAQNLQALVIGGCRDSEDSKDLHFGVKTILKDLKVKFSEIWGQDLHYIESPLYGKYRELKETNLHYDGPTDTYNISSTYNTIASNNALPINNVSDIKNTYKIINLLPNDELQINGVKV